MLEQYPNHQPNLEDTPEILFEPLKKNSSVFAF